MYIEKNLLDKIISTKTKCYFISPHFDDAVLSAGSLLLRLSKTNQITIVNVFTKASEKPYTSSAKRFIGSCRYKDADLLFNDREKEDAKVLKNKNIKIINLGYIDAIFRKKQQLNILEKLWSRLIPEISHIYPIYKYSVNKGKISRYDNSLLKEIKTSLNEIIKDKAIVFCPLAVGKHIDHVIINKVCSNLFSNCIYWIDFPYSQYQILRFSKNYKYFYFQVDKGEKIKMIKGYKSQYKSLFPKDIDFFPQEQFLLKNYISFS